jgi:hypothetical protein
MLAGNFEGRVVLLVRLSWLAGTGFIAETAGALTVWFGGRSAAALDARTNEAAVVMSRLVRRRRSTLRCQQRAAAANRCMRRRPARQPVGHRRGRERKPQTSGRSSAPTRSASRESVTTRTDGSRFPRGAGSGSPAGGVLRPPQQVWAPGDTGPAAPLKTRKLERSSGGVQAGLDPRLIG